MKKIAIAMLFISISMYTGMANAAYGNVPPQPLYPILNYYVRDLYKSFKNIPEERRYRLDEMVRYVENQQRMGRDAQIFFLGYDQPEVVQMLNIWSETAAFFFNLENISFFSGTEKAGNISDPAILALEKAGFIIYKTSLDGGQLYKVKYSYNLKPHFVFQKK
jgi:arsenate reductase